MINNEPEKERAFEFWNAHSVDEQIIFEKVPKLGEMWEQCHLKVFG